MSSLAFIKVSYFFYHYRFLLCLLTSIDEKFKRKSYDASQKLMQDLIDFRITTYFSDDIRIVVDLCEIFFDKVELIYDEPLSEVFKPLRKNMICRMPNYESHTFEELKLNNPLYRFIDNTIIHSKFSLEQHFPKVGMRLTI